MSVPTALRRTYEALQRSPILFVPIFVIVLFQLPQFTLRSTNPGLANFFGLLVLVALIVRFPFIHGGLIGMANAALDGTTTLTVFRKEGMRNLVPLFVVTLGWVALSVVLGILTSVAAIFALVARYPGGASDTGPFVAILVAFIALVALGYLLFAFFVQFYAQAVVTEGYGALESIRRSIGLVRTNLGNTLQFTLIVWGLSGVFGVIAAATSMMVTTDSTTWLNFPQPSFTGAASIALVVATLGALVGGFSVVFSVAFFRTLTD